MTERADWVSRATLGVRSLTPYQPGKPMGELRRELGLSHVVKLASNENPLGPSDAVLDAIAKAAKETHRYPDGSGHVLKTAIADKYGFAPECITLGNGSNEVLELLVRAFVNPGESVMYSEHAFAVYALATQAVGAIAQVIPAKNMGHDLDAMLSEILADDTPTPRVVFIANPNNPTGTWVDETALYQFITKVPEEVIVVVDQAYAEYMINPDYPTAEKWLSEFPNLVVTRSFSKAYGLAALRIGYGVSHASMAEVLNRVRPPFNTNHIAQMAAVAALADEAFIKRAVEVNQAGLAQIQAGLTDLGLSYIPTEANFICFDLKQEASGTNQSLLEGGVILRPIANYGLPNWLRVSVGQREENEYFLFHLQSLIS